MCVCVRDVLVVNGRERVVLCIDVNFSSVVGVCKCREMRANFKTRPRGGARGGGPRPAPAVYGSACVTGRAPVLTGHGGEQESERGPERDARRRGGRLRATHTRYGSPTRQPAPGIAGTRPAHRLHEHSGTELPITHPVTNRFRVDQSSMWQAAPGTCCRTPP